MSAHSRTRTSVAGAAANEKNVRAIVLTENETRRGIITRNFAQGEYSFRANRERTCTVPSGEKAGTPLKKVRGFSCWGRGECVGAREFTQTAREIPKWLRICNAEGSVDSVTHFSEFQSVNGART